MVKLSQRISRTVSNIKSKVSTAYKNVDKKVGGYLPGGVKPGTKTTAKYTPTPTSSVTYNAPNPQSRPKGGVVKSNASKPRPTVVISKSYNPSPQSKPKGVVTTGISKPYPTRAISSQKTTRPLPHKTINPNIKPPYKPQPYHTRLPPKTTPQILPATKFDKYSKPIRPEIDNKKKPKRKDNFIYLLIRTGNK